MFQAAICQKKNCAKNDSHLKSQICYHGFYIKKTFLHSVSTHDVINVTTNCREML